jgi:prepilin-type N-terminal cleavage/methylation domain-containing protein
MVRSSGRVRRGFTLIEMVVVLLVLSAVAAITVPAFLDAPVEDDMTVATRRVDLLFRLARDSAARGGKRVTVVIDSATSRVWFDVPGVSDPAALAEAQLGRTARMTITPGEELELPSSVTLQLSTTRARFTYMPTGAVYGDTLWLTSSLGSRIITLHPWTGDVLVH